MKLSDKMIVTDSPPADVPYNNYVVGMDLSGFDYKNFNAWKALHKWLDEECTAFNKFVQHQPVYVLVINAKKSESNVYKWINRYFDWFLLNYSYVTTADTKATKWVTEKYTYNTNKERP